MAERFKVFNIFPDESNEQVGDNLTDQQAVDMAMDYSQRPAAKIGMIDRIVITDYNDLTVFEWQFGKGVVFPTREDIENAKPKG